MIDCHSPNCFVLSSSHIPLEILSIATSFSSRNGYCVILKEIGGNRRLQMIVGASEAQGIAVSLEKIITSRPLTHHFIQDIVNEFGISLKYVLLNKYEDGVYHAQSVFEDSFGNTKMIDCRPSDALCIALKMEKPILAVEHIFDESSMRFLDLVEAPKKDDLLDYAKIESSKLKKMLKEAIEKEQFEVAAQIQNELNKR